MSFHLKSLSELSLQAILSAEVVFPKPYLAAYAQSKPAKNKLSELDICVSIPFLCVHMQMCLASIWGY